MSLTNGLCEQHWKSTEVVHECWECKVKELESELQTIAEIAHHGGLLGLTTMMGMTEIRRATLPYWDVDEADRLQRAALEVSDES
jgi:hypothetical protein